MRKDYALYIESLFKDYVGTFLSSRMVNSSTTNPAKMVSYRLKTLSLPVFNYYYQLFYVCAVDSNVSYKVIPSNIAELLTPVVLAHLVMGDGNYQTNANTIRIYTNAFSKQDLEILATAIETKFNIYVGVRHDRNNQYILAIGTKHIKAFQDLIYPHMHDSMLYRIGL